MEYDGGMDRPDAEAAALREVFRVFDQEGVREMVACAACAHFKVDPIGCDAIGSCSINGEGVGGRVPLYPRARRLCRDFKGFNA